jgi:hypothetical protein
MTTEKEPLFQYVNPNDLVEHEDAHRIPEMSTVEWDKFTEDVTESGEIKTPLFALRNGKVFDGRHRLRIAKERGIRLIPVLFYDITEDEALQRMADEAVLRRSLTAGQRAAVILEFSDLVKKVRDVARERQGARTDLLPNLAISQPKHTHVELAERANIGKSSMVMLQAVQRDEPDLFAQVKAGEITVNKAYTETKKRKMPVDDSVAIQKRIEEVQAITDVIIAKASEELAELPPTKDNDITPDNRMLYYMREYMAPFLSRYSGMYGTYCNCKDEDVRKQFRNQIRSLFEITLRTVMSTEPEFIDETMEALLDETR